MDDTCSLVHTLKVAVRQAGMTYADVARELGMSESNVKRLFSTGKFSLEQFGAVSNLIGLAFSDLARLHESSRRRITRLTRAQEQALVDDTLLLLAAVCVRNHWRMEDMVRLYRVTHVDCIRLFAQLDRLKIIELLPGERYRLLVAEDFSWIPGGPIEQFFESEILSEFLDADFAQPFAFRRYLGGAIAPASAAQLQTKIDELSREFAQLHARDAALPVSERTNFGIVMAMRPWELGAFSALRRESPG
jgi:AcrR family transcriptional regulator